MWPEVEEAATKKRHEIRLTGKKLVQRLQDAPGGLTELATACPFLTFVDLSDAGAILTALPDNFSQLSQLHELRCVHNGLRSLPDGLGKLPLLRTIIVEGNELQQLPPDLFNLPRLHTLNASHNQLTSLPEDALLAASELHYLDVSHNQLQSLPASLIKLPRLSNLIASYNNSISALPAKLSALSALSELQLAHCGLKAVPQSLAAVPKLKLLQLEGNPWEDKKLGKVLQEGRLKNIITHIKKHGAPPGAAEAAEEAAAAAAKLQIAESQKPYKLLPVNKDAANDVHVYPGVKDVRPHLVCAVVKGVKFTPSLYEKFIELQTELHDGLCKKRSVAAIGTHDLDKLKLPLTYEALPPADIVFVPLNRGADAEAGSDPATPAAAADAEGGSASSSQFQPGQEVTAAQLADYFAADKTMLRYLSYIQDKPNKAAPMYAVLRSSGQVLSVSPVINAEPFRITPDSSNILIEVSGTESLALVQQVASEFLERFSRAYSQSAAAAEAGTTAAGGQQGAVGVLQVAPVRLLTPGTGHVRSIWPRA